MTSIIVEIVLGKFLMLSRIPVLMIVIMFGVIKIEVVIEHNACLNGRLEAEED